MKNYFSIQRNWLLNSVRLISQKIPLTMKLFLFMISFSVCFVHASGGYAQTALLDINERNQTVGSILKKIENLTEFTFFYNTKQVDIKRRVSVESSQKDIFKVLDDIFKGTDVSYSVLDKSIILTNRQTLKSGFGDEVVQQASRLISGKVLDAQGEPLIGVSIAVKGAATGTLTDIDGKYSIKVTEGQVLVASYVGFKTAEVVVKAQTVINFTLDESNVALDEVVVTALGIKREQKALSYNVQQIKNEDVTTVKDANFLTSLAGKIAGVNITSASAGLGAATRVVMRGSKSIEQGNNALYVIDGIPIRNSSSGNLSGEFGSESGSEGIADINPDDIESMSVLSGPAASALYGSDAANGAILITTKKGRIGKPKIVYSNQTSFSKPLVLPAFQNTYGNAMQIYESWGDKLVTPSSYRPKDFFDTGFSIQNSLSLSVGNERNQTYASVAILNTDGIIPNSGYDRQNFSFRNTTNFLNEKLTLDFSLNYIVQKDRNMMAQGQYFNPLTAVYTYPRGENFDPIRAYEHYSPGRNIMVQYWPWKDQGLDMQNPYWVTNRNIFAHDKKRYMINTSLKYDVSDWLNVIGRVRVDNSNTEHTRKLYATTNTLHTGGKNTDTDKGYYGLFNNKDTQLYGDIIANINKYVQDFSIAANVGASFFNRKNSRVGNGGQLYRIPNFFHYTNMDRTKTVPVETGQKQVTQSVFASVEVGWKSMLYMTATGRIDWDSALKNTVHESFAYPSVGLSGIITEMVKMPSFISYMKVRGSYASVASPIPPALTMWVRAFDPNLWQYEQYKYRPLEKLYPERTRSWEVGLNTRFFNNTLILDATLYKSNTYNQTINVPLSASSGFSSMYIQTGNVQNKGIEASIGFDKKWGDFKMSSSFTAGFNDNKIVDLGRYEEDGEMVELENITKATVGSAQIRLTKGGTIGDMWTTSDLVYDINGNVWVNKDGMLAVNTNHMEKLGSTLSKWNFGLNNSFSWKDIRLGFLVTARTGGIVLSATQAILDSFGVSEASANLREQGGMPVNNGIIDARTWYKTVGGKQGVYKYYVYDATNVRLQEVNIGYALPSKWFNNVIKLNVSVVGRNLLMIYNKAPFDPQSTPSTGNYYQGIDYFIQPSQRNIGFSIKAEF